MTAAAAMLKGRIERRTVARGSKSERIALVLIRADGASYVLRRLGSSPFEEDSELANRIGQDVSLIGSHLGTTFIFSTVI